MGWGGGGVFGGGGGFGGGGSGTAAANGLPFGGIPSELQEGVNQLLADEPDHGEPQARYTPASPARGAAPAQPAGIADRVPPHPRLGGGAHRRHQHHGPGRPTLTGIAINQGMSPGHERFWVVALIAVLYLVTVSITALAQRWQVRASGRLAAWVMNDLRVKVFTHLQRMSLDYFTEEKAGVVMTRMTSDIENLQQLLQDGLSQFAHPGPDHDRHRRGPLLHQRLAGPHHRAA